MVGGGQGGEEAGRRRGWRMAAGAWLLGLAARQAALRALKP